MEYADRGDGPVVLVIHGSPGGYDQGLVYGEELKRRGFRIIAISRPGYLRTPLLTGVTMEEQADAIDSLLSTLGFTSCAVLGIAEGAPSALQLAMRHPERVTTLALLSPTSMSLGSPPIASLGYQLFHDLTVLENVMVGMHPLTKSGFCGGVFIQENREASCPSQEQRLGKVGPSLSLRVMRVGGK